ncbi:retrotransposon protein, putative, ty1-copia subclass [Tanacetum coccineum]
MFVIEQPLLVAPTADSKAQVLTQWNAVYDAYNEVACLILGKEEGKPVGPHVLMMKGYVEQLEWLGYVLSQDISVGLILNGLTSDFARFVRNYNMHNMGKTVGELHALLIEHEKGLPKKAATPQAMAIQGGRIRKANKKSQNVKGKGRGKGKGKDKSYIPKPKNHKPSAKELPAKDDACHHCKEVRHWKRNCLVYLAELIMKKKQVGTTSSSGYPKETTGYYFYFPPENKIVVARYAEFLEKNLLSQEISRRAKELEEIQDEDTSPSKNTSDIPMEVKGFELPQEEVVHIRRSARIHRDPDRLSLNVKVEEHSLGDLNEPTNYKAVILDPKSDKWVDAINAEMFGFAQDLDVPRVYQKASGSNVTFLILYVDDIIIMGNHIPSLQSVKTYLGKCFAMKYLGEAAFIHGIKIYRDRSKRLIGLCQSAYMDKILKRFRIDTTKRGYIPMQERLDLNKTQGASTPEEVNRMQNVPYASAVGSIMYATAVKTILKYLRNTKDMFLVYGGNPKAELRVDCYCDAGFETDKDDTKSQTCYVFILNGGAVDWKSSKKFISGLGIVPIINKPIKMFCNNSAALHFASEPGVQKGTRHYHRRYYYVRECIEMGEIKLLKVHTDDNLANPFMKALSKGKLTQHARSIDCRYL